MLKKLMRAFPYLMLALAVSLLLAGLDAVVTKKMLGMLDLALKGDIAAMKAETLPLLAGAVILVPLGVAEALTGNFYRKKVNLNIKYYYVEKVFGKNIREFQKENNGRYLSAMTNDFNTLETNLIMGIYTVGRGVISFLAGMWLLSTVDYRMIFFAFGIIVVNLTISVITSKPLKRNYKERSDLFDGYTSYIKEVLSAFHIVKNYNLQDKVTEDYYQKSDEIQNKGFIIDRMMSFVNASQNLFMNGSFYGILCGIGYMAVTGKITAGGLIVIMEGINRMAFPIFDLAENLPKLFTAGDLIKKIEDSLKNSDAYEETVELKDFDGEIQFREVGFHYEEDERQILKNINLTLKKNGKYLVVGPSGGGKSTFLRLLRKYVNPTEGTIFIDGYDLMDVKKEDYFGLIANIEQQVFLFEDTVRNNITLYKECEEEEIQRAIKASGLLEFIQGLPNGLDTIIYDNGKNVSGGERSRIVIARALLSKARILLMDEAFASLDMERAREIEKTILGLEGITVINVSHVLFKDTKDSYDNVITIKGTSSLRFG
ncbi:ABC transporter ATP-binding protein [Anaerocolumna xylanovorans]|uniref:ATP-binding cassette, subfamily C n=1 Tax=Anaerocolumna xylanovorans DSM 12503 TaxID=1121345 RepID=A0A1M7XX60_9FIRM|nr:ABC transporter ATP-binding protein [Anaerocolumna xylanovorans]SHO43429.1 ATP-binding cassette, subfamily C [Anaerocolumna xylanovorans DSM 12503]